MDPLVAMVLLFIFLGALLVGWIGYVDRIRARDTDRRLADKYGQPYQVEER